MKLRKVKTRENHTAVQVVNYVNGRREILEHLGTGRTEEEIKGLEEKGYLWIQENGNGSPPLFKEKAIDENEIFNRDYTYVGLKLNFAYQLINNLIQKFNFHLHLPKMIQELLIAQVLESGSKRHLIRYLEEKMQIIINHTRVYEWFPVYDDNLRVNLQKEAVSIAKTELGFDFSFVLYDVTTLYFESFEKYEFQKPGFSKDNKANQPQIVIGLVVTQEGFPVHYEVFKGNTAEGKTFLEVILDFKKKQSITTLTVVADAAMSVKFNMEELEKVGIKYILGAKLLKQEKSILEKIHKDFKKTDGNSLKITETLLIDYSQKRFNKDKSDLDKYKKKAEVLVGKETTKLRKLKYLKNTNTTYSLDTELITKHEKLLGVKGYVTNLTGKTNAEIIGYYHSLFKVEKAFRISKSDLEIRPIFHHKEKSIRNHILLCFCALAISTYLEIKTKLSTKEIQHQLNSMYEIHFKSNLTGNTVKTSSELSTFWKEIERGTH